MLKIINSKKINSKNILRKNRLALLDKLDFKHFVELLTLDSHLIFCIILIP